MEEDVVLGIIKRETQTLNHMHNNHLHN